MVAFAVWKAGSVMAVGRDPRLYAHDYERDE